MHEVRRRRAPSCVHSTRPPRRNAARPIDQVAFIRILLDDLGYGTTSPDLFWCPAHSGRAPALKVAHAEGRLNEGLAVLECAAGCAPVDVLRAMGLTIMRPSDPDLSQTLHIVLPLAVA